MIDTREATPRRMMKLVTDGAGLQTKIYAESPEGPILMATAVNYDVAEYMASAVNHFDEVVEALREARADILHLANSRWSEVEWTDDELVGYIDALLSKLEASHGSA